ncbi:MAG: PEP-CTERM sorting domain-containing protein, partial [Planctomycetia bacterium]|nr:PEP-CTERM sorting domain-containing protein [Planctomycetia bacterium]
STSDRTATLSGTVTLSGDALITTAAMTGLTGNRLLLSGPVQLGANTLTLRPDAGNGVAVRSEASLVAPIVITGTMTGSGNVVIDGPSAVYLDGVNQSTGSTTVLAGTLGGDGVITGAVIVEAGAMLAPGSDADATGSLEVGSLFLADGATPSDRATALMQINGTDAGLYDQVVSAGNVTYGGNLVVDFQRGGFAAFDVWQLFTAADHLANFSTVSARGFYGDLSFSKVDDGEWRATGGSLGDGESLSFYVNDLHAFNGRFTAGQLVLVPEPSTLVIAGIGLAVIGWRRCSQRRRTR